MLDRSGLTDVALDFTVTVTDAAGGTASDDFTTLTGADDDAIAVADTDTVAADSSLRVEPDSGGLLDNDVDVDANDNVGPRKVHSNQYPKRKPQAECYGHGGGGGAGVIDGAHGTLTVFRGGRHDYAPDHDAVDALKDGESVQDVHLHDH